MAEQIWVLVQARPRLLAETLRRMMAKGKIRKNTSIGACHVAVQTLIVLRLDYCNVLLAGVRAYQVNRLHKVVNRARLTMCVLHKTLPTTRILRDLHWYHRWCTPLRPLHGIAWELWSLGALELGSFGTWELWNLGALELRIGIPLCVSVPSTNSF